MKMVCRAQEEMEKCREAFEQFDMDKSGTIEPWELKVNFQMLISNLGKDV